MVGGVPPSECFRAKKAPSEGAYATDLNSICQRKAAAACGVRIRATTWTRGLGRAEDWPLQGPGLATVAWSMRRRGYFHVGDRSGSESRPLFPFHGCDHSTPIRVCLSGRRVLLAAATQYIGCIGFRRGKREMREAALARHWPSRERPTAMDAASLRNLWLLSKHLLVPYIETMSIVLALRVLTTMASMLVSLSPAADMYKIHREKSTGPKSILPVVALCCNSHIWMWYGYLTSKFFPLCLTSVFAQLCGSVFISIYYYHSARRSRVRLMLAVAACVVAPVVCFTILTIAGLTGQTMAQVAHIMGYIGASFSISVLASPWSASRSCCAPSRRRRCPRPCAA